MIEFLLVVFVALGMMGLMALLSYIVAKGVKE